MNINFDSSMLKMMAHEGGDTDDERDPGNRLPNGRAGSTNLGVTSLSGNRLWASRSARLT